LERSSAWSTLAYRPLSSPGSDAAELFAFVGAWMPPEGAVDSGWGAWADSRLAGALLMERAGAAGMLHGPVVVTPETPGTPGTDDASAVSGAAPADAVEVAARLLTDALAHASAHGIDTLYTRPQGLDPVWVRFGFIPLPEATLPRALRNRPGTGLFAWRGGSALWSANGRGVPQPASRSRR
jgi:hypothetical protein